MSHGRSAPGTVGVVIAVLLATGLTGCTQVEQATPPVHEPAKVDPVRGSAVHRVTFDRRAVEKVSLETVRVRRLGAMLVVPYAALIYDEHGSIWVYTSVGPREYLRALVVVDRIDGDLAWLQRGPAAGTPVVTVGATEVYGAELGIAGGH